MATDTDRAILARVDAHEEAHRGRHEDVISRLVRIEEVGGRQSKVSGDHEDRIRSLEAAKYRAAGAKAALTAAAVAGGGGIATFVQWLMGGGG